MSTLFHRRSDPLDEPGFLRGQSAAIQSINSVVAEIAGTDIPVLLLGESGTGKDVYARVIHQLSGLREGPLKKLSCVTQDLRSLMQKLQESLSLRGKDRRAGTLFLDGIDELDGPCQRTLLSLLPDGDVKNGANTLVGRIICSASIFESALFAYVCRLCGNERMTLQRFLNSFSSNTLESRGERNQR